MNELTPQELCACVFHVPLEATNCADTRQRQMKNDHLPSYTKISPPEGTITQSNCSSWAPNLSNWRLNLYLFKQNFLRKCNRRPKESKRNEKTNTVRRCCSSGTVRGPHPVTCSSLPSRRSEIIFPYLCEGRKWPQPPRKLSATPVGTTWTLFRDFHCFNPIWFLHPAAAICSKGQSVNAREHRKLSAPKIHFLLLVGSPVTNKQQQLPQIETTTMSLSYISSWVETKRRIAKTQQKCWAGPSICYLWLGSQICGESDPRANMDSLF